MRQAVRAMHEIETPRLRTRAFAEFLGTGLLVVVVVGSGITAQRLSPGDPGLQLLQNSLATAFGLAVVILIFQTVSGSHVNPVVTLADAALRRACGGWRDVAAYVPAQIAGAIGGSLLANAMFGADTALSSTERADLGRVLGEVVATAGLVLLVFALVRTGRTAIVAPAVGAYIGAAYWFTSSTAFANPAVTIGRVFTDTLAGIAPISAAVFLGAQLLGAAVGVLLTVALFPRSRTALAEPPRAS